MPIRDEGIRDLLESGRKEDAIRIYRDFTGVDEFTAKEAIENIEREIRLANNHRV